MLNRLCAVAACASAVLLALPTQASRAPWRPVSVEIVDASGVSFEQFPTRGEGGALRAYLRAERGERYRIRVSNKSGERVGVVIAVDGRNVITGARSELARDESMYVLNPWESNEYSGWRTSMQDVHEFYFTEWSNSYAEAFGDRTARGVIAVAVYREKDRPHMRRFDRPQPYAENESKAESRTQAPATAGAAEAARAKRDAEPGTGFGEQRHEPVTRVTFEAERSATSRIFLKYEWPEMLCRKRIANCQDEANRFWNDDLAFAPFPPGRR